MDFNDTPAEAAFREEVKTWLQENLTGDFAALEGAGGVINDDAWVLRVEWEKLLGANRWLGIAWPEEYGGRNATIMEQVIFIEEYVRAQAPARVSFFGEGLFAPTLLAFGTDEQKQRFLPKIQSVDELWCQGYSEPNAGSDLANVATKAVLDGDEWIINGQKVWTTLAHRADWMFAVVRTDSDAPKHQGLSYLLVPMKQDGVTVRPLVQMTNTREFSEVFLDDARTDASNVLGEVNGGWPVALATLSFERGTAFLGQQLSFSREFDALVDKARELGKEDDAHVRDRLAQAFIELQIMKYNGLRMLTNMIKTGAPGPEASIGKLYWSSWHKRLGELSVDILGPYSQLLVPTEDPSEYEINEFQRTFLFSRAETIYAGSSEIQKNIISERVLGMPKG